MHCNAWSDATRDIKVRGAIETKVYLLLSLITFSRLVNILIITTETNGQ